VRLAARVQTMTETKPKMRTPPRAALLVATMLSTSNLFGCGGEALTVYVSGTVTDRFGTPIEGATVRLDADEELADDRTAFTNANGDYDFVVEGFGSLALVVTADGFARARQTIGTVDVPDTSGSFRAGAVRDFRLYPTTGTVQGRIRWVDSGASAVRGAALRMRIEDFQIQDPDLALRTTTDDDGAYRFDGLPAGATATLFISSWDRDGDGTPETSGTSVRFTINAEGVTRLDRNVSQFDFPDAVWSSVGNQVVDPDAVIEIVYNVPMRSEPGFRQVVLRRLTDGTDTVAQTTSFSDDGTRLTITPVQNLTPGDRYEIRVEAETRATGEVVFYSQDFRVSGANEAPAAPTNLRLEDPDEEFDWNSTTFRLVWDAVPEADRYSVYARRTDGDVTDWVLATTLSANNPIIQRAFVGLPPVLRDPRWNTALQDGGTLEYAVTARIGDAESAPSNAVQIRDTRCLTVAAAFQASDLDSWNNATSNEPAEVGATILFNGPVDLSTAPSFTLPAGLGAASFEVVWVDEERALLRGTVPAMTNGAGTLVFDFSEVTDRSGNGTCSDLPMTRSVSVF
jgi:hypothetical protein